MESFTFGFEVSFGKESTHAQTRTRTHAHTYTFTYIHVRCRSPSLARFLSLLHSVSSTQTHTIPGSPDFDMEIAFSHFLECMYAHLFHFLRSHSLHAHTRSSSRPLSFCLTVHSLLAERSSTLSLLCRSRSLRSLCCFHPYCSSFSPNLADACVSVTLTLFILSFAFTITISCSVPLVCVSVTFTFAVRASNSDSCSHALSRALVLVLSPSLALRLALAPSLALTLALAFDLGLFSRGSHSYGRSGSHSCSSLAFAFTLAVTISLALNFVFTLRSFLQIVQSFDTPMNSCMFVPSNEYIYFAKCGYSNCGTRPWAEFDKTCVQL